MSAIPRKTRVFSSLGRSSPLCRRSMELNRLSSLSVMIGMEITMPSPIEIFLTPSISQLCKLQKEMNVNCATYFKLIYSAGTKATCLI